MKKRAFSLQHRKVNNNLPKPPPDLLRTVVWPPISQRAMVRLPIAAAMAKAKSKRLGLRKSPKAISLLELMVTVVILSIGITAVLRSFLSAVYALDSASNYLKAIQFLEGTMGEIEEKAIRENGLLPYEREKEIQLGRRRAIEKTNAALLKDSEDDLNEVKITLSWCQSGNRKQNEILTTYVKKKEE